MADILRELSAESEPERKRPPPSTHDHNEDKKRYTKIKKDTFLKVKFYKGDWHHRQKISTKIREIQIKWTVRQWIHQHLAHQVKKNLSIKAILSR